MKQLIKNYIQKMPFIIDLYRKLTRLKWWYIDYNAGKKFQIASIETMGQCNRVCGYCPVSKDDKRTGKITEETFRKTVQQLKDYGFTGSLRFHFYNEPLLDKRLDEFIGYARKELPKCEFNLFTNGDLLTENRIKSLCDNGMDVITVSSHDEDSYNKVREVIKESKYAKHIYHKSMYNSNELMNRGGIIDVPESNNGPSMKYGCLSVMSMEISYTGNIVLCCNDFYETTVLGSVHDDTIDNIWNSKKNSKLRKDIFFAQYDLEICKKCVGLF